MKAKTTNAYDEVSNIAPYEDSIMALLHAIHDTAECKVAEDDICACVHNLSNINCGIIILSIGTTSQQNESNHQSDLNGSIPPRTILVLK